MLIDTTGVLQRLWKFHSTDPCEKKMGNILISNIKIPCSDADFSGIIFLMMRLLNLLDMSIMGCGKVSKGKYTPSDQAFSKPHGSRGGPGMDDFAPAL